ncbi:hypothetical protein [Allocoleopsis sp.]|uniref:hypothetical protein n=1 Tax=Allocoleopsis sp. TaxID=3088169 RepID=UPI002FD61AFE
MSLQKLALPLTVSVLCIGYYFRCSGARLYYGTASLAQSKELAVPVSQPILTAPLKAAIEEVRVMKIKIERDNGINLKEYGEDLSDLENIIDKVYGDPKTVTAVKSVVEGHKLALKFLKCDRVEGYDEMHQCRDQVLKKLFVKYPDLAAAVQEAVEGEKLPYLSAGLDKDAVLQAIWQEIAKDTDTLLQRLNLEPTLEASKPQN